ncbi:heme-dependent oxidative N-demethylase subunit alpha family protein, partial [Mesorhizobium sp. M4B.F.Ca.ET.214.01.1.1]|uniref:heme-dependent oxidative N-demethylase subunit alpha family protein n=1 Tax=Mesorhizobium sp. M4B.F.Ca.ET.214.01.1.1 TaxID=2563955 RepID=UPI00109401CC
HRRGDAGVAVVGVTSHPAIYSSLAGAPLVAASLLVQEDLILMRRDVSGWRLAAGSLCFPSSWALTEKFGKPLQQIHAPVPGFGPGTRPADLINRMFDGLQGQAVE